MPILIALILFVLIQSVALANTEPVYQSHRTIRDAVISFMESNLRRQNLDFDIQFNNLDPRLKLPQCATPLAIFTPPGSHSFGNVSVGVRCTGKKPWTIYTSVKTTIFRDVVVLTKTLERGAAVTLGAIGKKRIQLSRTHQQYFTEYTEVLGKTARRNLTAGAILSMGFLTNPKTVERGQQVTLIAHANGMKIRMQGAALMDGFEGQRIRVRNISSNRIVEGTVVSAGLVKINF